jgi:hypothetical protein
VSFNELIDMYENHELVIAPEYQRLFRWSRGKQSRFIESLVLEMPVPPIYVIENREGGVYELIDGLQRVSSYIHFVKGHPTDRAQGSLILDECDVVPELNSMTYGTLPRALEIKLKRSFIRMEVLRKESDPRLRYYMFKRLNTGGESLSEQEIRNCTIRLLDSRFNDFIIDLSGDQNFRSCIANLSEEKEKQKYDQELVLRFFAFKNWRQEYRHDVGDFMTEYMERVTDGSVQFDFEMERATFQRTVEVLNASIGPDAFAAVNERGKFISKFLIYHYEAVMLGLQPFVHTLDPTNADQMVKLSQVLTEAKLNKDFQQITKGGGRNRPLALNERVGFIQDALQRHFVP